MNGGWLLFFLARPIPRFNVRPMKSKLFFLLAATLLLTVVRLAAADVEPGFTPLCDGKTFKGWKTAEENKDTWKVKDGEFVAHGERCHLFYVGDEKPFRNFDLKVEVMTEPSSNGGIYFHTKYQPDGWPKAGFECQVNNTHSDWIKTSSLYGLVNIAQSPVDAGDHRARQQCHGAGGWQKSVPIQ